MAPAEASVSFICNACQKAKHPLRPIRTMYRKGIEQLDRPARSTQVLGGDSDRHQGRVDEEDDE